jgi:hypothetical protein
MSAALYETLTLLPDLPGAACRDHDPTLWDGRREQDPRSRRKAGKRRPQSDFRTAKAICNVCPERLACLEYALREGISIGIWGGKTEDERNQIRSGRPGSASTTYRRRRCATGQHLLPARSNNCRSCQRARKAERLRGGTPVLGPPCPACKLGKIRCTHRVVML